MFEVGEENVKDCECLGRRKSRVLSYGWSQPTLVAGREGEVGRFLTTVTTNYQLPTTN